MRSSELDRALAAAGGVTALARALALDPSTVSGWRQLPARHVGAVARLTGLAAHALRPDLFPENPKLDFAETQAPFATEARVLGLDPEAIARKAIRDAITAEKARRWQEENREAIAAQNEWVEKHGVPLAKYRMF